VSLLPFSEVTEKVPFLNPLYSPKCALWLDEKLRSGMSEPCETFESPSLSRSADFNCYGVELWGFVMPESSSLVSGSSTSGSIGGVVVR